MTHMDITFHLLCERCETNDATGEFLCDSCAAYEATLDGRTRELLTELRIRVRERTRAAFLAHDALRRLQRGRGS